MKGICILGSSGSIGISTLDVVKRHPDKYKVVALTANQNVELLYHQCLEFQPEYAVLVDVDRAEQLDKRLKQSPALNTEVLANHS